MAKIEWEKINRSIYDNFEQIIEIFGLNLTDNVSGEYCGPCCVHENSDNPTAFKVYPNGTWWCYTRGCADGQVGLICLLRKLLENSLHIECNLSYTVNWYIDTILGGKLPSGLSKPSRRIEYNHIPKVFYESIDEWRKTFNCPSPAYIKLGFADWVVDEYNIGECHDQSSGFYNRIVVPQLNRDGKVVGYTGRSMFPCCERCKLYHSPLAPCPSGQENRGNFAKWKHKKFFKTSYHLFNDWTLQSPDVILVESVGNTLKLLMALCSQVGGLYGNRLSSGQARILEELGVKRIIWIADRDNTHGAGLQGAIKSQEKYPQFKFRIVLPPEKDVGQMEVGRLKLFLSMEGIR
jgi:hypothetical protein